MRCYDKKNVLHDQSITKFITEVSKSVFAVLSNIDGCICDESVCICVLGTEFISIKITKKWEIKKMNLSMGEKIQLPSNACVRRQIKHIYTVWANILRGIANSNGSSIQNPQSTALIGCNSIDGVQSIWTITNRIRTPVRVWNQLRWTAYRLLRINISQRCRNTFRKTKLWQKY